MAEETCCGTNPAGMTDKEFSEFCKTPGFIANAPAGKLELLGTGTVYVDGAGQWLSKEAYVKTHNGADPEILWQAVKRYRAEHGLEKAVKVLGVQPVRAPVQYKKLGRY